MHRTPFTLLAAALAALLLWLWWPTAIPAPGPGGTSGIRSPVAVAPPDAVLATLDPTVTATATDSLPGDARVPMPAAGADTTLVVEVHDSEGRLCQDLPVLAAPLVLADPWHDERSATTRSDGRAQFELAAGTWRCRTPIGGSVVVTFGPGEHAMARIDLPPGREVAGRVVGPDGIGIGAAVVLLVDAANAARAHPIARCAADGSFRLRDLQDDAWVSAAHAGYAPSAPQRAASAPTEALTIVLRPMAGRCRGLVVDPAGNPVADAVVVLGVDQQFLAAADSRAGAPPMQQLRTGADGRFASDPLPLQPIAVQARCPGIGVGRGTVTIVADQTAEVTIELRPGATVRGVARTPGGQPIEGAFLWNAPLRSFGCRIANSAADGSYQLTELAPGRVSLRAQLPPGAAVAADLDLAEGAVVTWDPAVPTDPDGVVSGRIVDAEDGPLPGWRIVARTADEVNGLGAESDAEGRFTIRGLRRSAVVRLGARGPDAGWTGFAMVTVDDVPVDGPEVLIRVDANPAARGALRGVVVGADRSGVPATVRLQHASHAEVAVYRTDDTGRFHIDGVPAGTVRVEIQAPDLARLRLPDQQVPAGGQCDVGTVELQRGGAVGGRLLDRDGRSPTAATVLALDHAGQLAEEVACNGGDYHTSLLPAGNYTLMIQAEGYAGARMAVPIQSGRDQILDVQLQPGYAHTVAVATREPDQQTAKTSILLFDARGEPLWFAHLPMRGGRAEFALFLEPGDYSVTALGVDRFAGSAVFSVGPGGDGSGGVTQIELRAPH